MKDSITKINVKKALLDCRNSLIYEHNMSGTATESKTIRTIIRTLDKFIKEGEGRKR